MGCLAKITNSLNLAVNPNNESDAYKALITKKAAGYLALGVLTAISAVALVALGITLLVLNTSLGFIPLAVAIPVFWLGHSIAVISTNYIKIAKNSAPYWSDHLNSPYDQKILKDLTKGTITCKSCMDPKTKQKLDQANFELNQAHAENIQAARGLAQQHENLKIAIQQQQIDQQAMKLQNEVEAAEKIKNLMEETDQKIAKAEQDLQENLATSQNKLKDYQTQIQNLEDKFPFQSEDEEKTLEVLRATLKIHQKFLSGPEYEKRQTEATKKTIDYYKQAFVMLSSNYTLLLFDEEAKGRVLSPYYEKYPELKLK